MVICYKNHIIVIIHGLILINSLLVWLTITQHFLLRNGNSLNIWEKKYVYHTKMSYIFTLYFNCYKINGVLTTFLTWIVSYMTKIFWLTHISSLVCTLCQRNWRNNNCCWILTCIVWDRFYSLLVRMFTYVFCAHYNVCRNYI